MTRLDIRDASLVDVLPDSLTADAELVAMARALDIELRDVADAIVEATILSRIADCSEEVLNELAWAFDLNSLQLWDVATPDGKRAVLAQIFKVRKRSGTPYAVKRVFELLQVDGEIVEWFEEAGTPYTYRIRITVGDEGLTLIQQVGTREWAYRFAPASRYMSEFGVERDESASIEMRAVPMTGTHTTIEYGGP